MSVVHPFIWWVQLKNIERGTVERAILDVMIRKGHFPAEIISDDGTEFVNQVIDDINLDIVSNHRLTTSYRPKANGLVERSHNGLKSTLVAYCWAGNSDLVYKLRTAEWAYKTTRRDCRGDGGWCYSPYQLEYGRDPKNPFLILAGGEEEEQIWEVEKEVFH